MALTMGARPALFSAATQQRPDFAFGSLGGGYTLMAFMPGELESHVAAMAELERQGASFGLADRAAFSIVQDRQRFEDARTLLPWLRHFHDPDSQIADVFLLNDDEKRAGCFILLDPSLRVVVACDLDRSEALYRLIANLAPAELHGGVPIHAPVLILPRIFEPDFCRRLIDVYNQDGGARSGVMRQIDGMTVGVIDGFKSRKDAHVTDPELKKQIRLRITHRLLPEIEKAFSFKATRMERYIVARYNAEEGGYFKRHRDNTTKGTAHRQFACSINLNAEEFEGGNLRFPEFGPRTYRPPTGGAVIFSCSLLHEATPVTKGTRFAFLPFFHDEANEKIRMENHKFVSGTIDGRTVGAGGIALPPEQSGLQF